MISPLEWYLTELVAQVQPITAGQINPVTADIIYPDSDTVGITLTTVEGYQYSAGAVDHQFAIQSIAKAFTYGLALEDLGPEVVAKSVNVEPSGDAFNKISLETDGRPDNPMITAGAIATVGLIKDQCDTKRITRISHSYHAAGRCWFTWRIRNESRRLPGRKSQRRPQPCPGMAATLFRNS